MSRPTPTGFVARCQCGVYIGAIDVTGTLRADSAKWVGEWLLDGYTVEPRFGSWQQKLGPRCKCDANKQTQEVPHD